MDMFTLLTVVKVLRVYSYVKTCQIVYLKYVQYVNYNSVTLFKMFLKMYAIIILLWLKVIFFFTVKDFGEQERLSNLSKITRLVSSYVRIWS